jgi:chromatin remodeling complex protein RSC6
MTPQVSSTRTKAPSTPKPVKAKAVPKAVPAPVAEPTPVADEILPVEEAPVVVEEIEPIESQIQKVRETITLLVKDLTEKLKDFKVLDAELKKIAVSSKKHFKKKTKKNSPKNSDFGFNAHVLISDELADFLNVPHGTSMRPPQVFSKFNDYAKEHNCKDESNKSIFKCDAKMKKLLGEPVHLIKKNDPSLGYGVSNFNINKYFSKHYTKITPTASE